MKRFSALLVALAMVFSLASCGSSSSTTTTPAPSTSTEAPAASGSSEGWTPDRAIELVACYGAGGGHDILLRTMQKIIVDEKLSTANFNVVNKDGGSGAIGMAYVDGHKGDAHYLMCTTSSFTTTPPEDSAGLQLRELHPHRSAGPGPLHHRGPH